MADQEPSENVADENQSKSNGETQEQTEAEITPEETAVAETEQSVPVDSEEPDAQKQDGSGDGAAADKDDAQADQVVEPSSDDAAEKTEDTEPTKKDEQQQEAETAAEQQEAETGAEQPKEAEAGAEQQQEAEAATEEKQEVETGAEQQEAETGAEQQQEAEAAAEEKQEVETGAEQQETETAAEQQQETEAIGPAETTQGDENVNNSALEEEAPPTDQENAEQPAQETEQVQDTAVAEPEQAAEGQAEVTDATDANQNATAETGTEQATDAATAGTEVAEEQAEQTAAQEEAAQQEEEETQEKAQEAEGEQQEAVDQVEETPEQQQEAPEEELGRTAAEKPQTPPKIAVAEPEIRSQDVKVLSTKPAVNLEAGATVKFVLMPSSQVVTLACTLGQTLAELKAHFSSELKMPSSVFMLMFDGKTMADDTRLADLGVGPNGTVQLEMQSSDPVNNPLKPYRPRQEYHMPDVITVRVMTEDCEAKDVVVEIERSRGKKTFLGGFRNKNTGVEYHNAAAQTVSKPRPPPTAERYCRDTQTCEQKNTRQQTTNTTSTQMTGIGVYVSNEKDKLIVPGKYFSADDYWTLILSKVIILQKYYRRWLAKRYVTKLKEDKEKRLEWERQEELRKKKEKEDRLKREYARRINPKTKADFDMLINCLEKWRQEEMERINATLTGAERKAAMCMLLDQETELLSAIERHKNEANLDNREKRIMAFLEKAAAPKKWAGHDGKLTYMDTPYTIRAKELRDIYNSINMKYLTQDERLDVLLTLKHTVKEHDCKLTQEVIELIDREADLLMRGVKEANLTGLRKRISTLFLQYIKTPTFNPEAAKLLKVPQDPSTLRKNINYCHSCGNYLPSTEFFITSNSRTVGRCRNCEKVENDGRQRQDHSYYKVMLKALRKSEEGMQDGSKICYLLQENDLRYLVENIWSNQSVLSAWDDLYDLVLVRWDKHQEWSPWNCILLTHDEAEAHKKLFSLEEGYGHVFIHKVTQKHNFARNYFSRLPGMAEVLRERVGGTRDFPAASGPSVAGHSVPKAAQKV